MYPIRWVRAASFVSRSSAGDVYGAVIWSQMCPFRQGWDIVIILYSSLLSLIPCLPSISYVALVNSCPPFLCALPPLSLLNVRSGQTGKSCPTETCARTHPVSHSPRPPVILAASQIAARVQHHLFSLICTASYSSAFRPPHPLRMPGIAKPVILDYNSRLFLIFESVTVTAADANNPPPPPPPGPVWLGVMKGDTVPTVPLDLIFTWMPPPLVRCRPFPWWWWCGVGDSLLETPTPLEIEVCLQSIGFILFLSFCLPPPFSPLLPPPLSFLFTHIHLIPIFYNILTLPPLRPVRLSTLVYICPSVPAISYSTSFVPFLDP